MKKTTYRQYLCSNLTRVGRYFFAALFYLLLPAITNAAMEAHEMQIDFFFDSQSVPGKEIAGYRLYKEGNLECETGPIEPQSIACTVASPAGTFAFTLSVFFDDGYESPQSAPFDFYIHDDTSPIKVLQVLVDRFPPDINGLGSIAGNAAVNLADVIHLLRHAAVQ